MMNGMKEQTARFGFRLNEHNVTPDGWIPVAKVGTTTRLTDGIIRQLTSQGLASSVSTWKGRPLIADHESPIDGLTIKDAKFEEPFLYMQFGEPELTCLNGADVTGVSIDYRATDYNDTSMFAGYGVGLSVMHAPNEPVCSSKMGCFGINFKKELQETGMTEQLQNRVEELTANFAKKQGEFETLTAEFKAKTAEVETLQGELESSKTKITDLESKVAEFAKEKEETLKATMKAEFQAIIDSGKIPAGKIHKQEDKDVLEAMFMEDPRKFAVTLAGYKEADFAKTEEGAEYGIPPSGNSGADKEFEEYDATFKAMHPGVM